MHPDSKTQEFSCITSFIYIFYYIINQFAILIKLELYHNKYIIVSYLIVSSKKISYKVSYKKIKSFRFIIVSLKMQIVNIITRGTLGIFCRDYETIADVVLKMYHSVFLVSCLESANLGRSVVSCLNASILKSTFEVNCQGMARYHQVLPGWPLATN